MRIDASLARGLAKEFFARVQVEANKFLERIEPAELAPAGDLSNKKAANRFCKKLDAIASKCPIVLQHRTTGVRNNAHWWATHPNFNHDLQDDVWNERVLSVYIERVWLVGQRLQPTYGHAFIGEHCIARLFQRMPWPSMPNSFSILEELRYLANVLPWHVKAHHYIAQLNGGLRLSKFIPTPHGVFLGVSHPSDVELMKLATFVSYDQLSDFQKELWSYLFVLQSHPDIEENLGIMLDPRLDSSEVAKHKWWYPMFQFMCFIMNFAPLLQRELDTLHPHILWANTNAQPCTIEERRQSLMETFDLKEQFEAELRNEVMGKRREAARQRASELTNR